MGFLINDTSSELDSRYQIAFTTGAHNIVASHQIYKMWTITLSSSSTSSFMVVKSFCLSIPIVESTLGGFLPLHSRSQHFLV